MTYFRDNPSLRFRQQQVFCGIPAYDAFSGSTPKDALWLDAAEDFGEACDRMKQLANKSPGPYFAVCQKTRQILAHINTQIAEDIQRSAYMPSIRLAGLL